MKVKLFKEFEQFFYLRKMLWKTKSEKGSHFSQM